MKEISDEELLDYHGIEIICHTPFELEHTESGSTADGVLARTLLLLLRLDWEQSQDDERCKG